MDFLIKKYSTGYCLSVNQLLFAIAVLGATSTVSSQCGREIGGRGVAHKDASLYIDLIRDPCMELTLQ